MFEKLHFREVNPNDSLLLFELRNDVEVRENSIKNNPIKWDEHSDWFNNILNDDTKFLYLFFRDSIFLGQVRFDIFNDEANINISITKSFRGQGFSKELIIKSIDKLLKTHSHVKKIVAYIRPQNQASIKSFTKVGFVFSELVEINDDQFNKYLLFRESYE